MELGRLKMTTRAVSGLRDGLGAGRQAYGVAGAEGRSGSLHNSYGTARRAKLGALCRWRCSSIISCIILVCVAPGS